MSVSKWWDLNTQDGTFSQCWRIIYKNKWTTSFVIYLFRFSAGRRYLFIYIILFRSVLLLPLFDSCGVSLFRCVGIRKDQYTLHIRAEWSSVWRHVSSDSEEYSLSLSWPPGPAHSYTSSLFSSSSFTQHKVYDYNFTYMLHFVLKTNTFHWL